MVLLLAPFDIFMTWNAHWDAYLLWRISILIYVCFVERSKGNQFSWTYCLLPFLPLHRKWRLTFKSISIRVGVWCVFSLFFLSLSPFCCLLRAIFQWLSCHFDERNTHFAHVPFNHMNNSGAFCGNMCSIVRCLGTFRLHFTLDLSFVNSHTPGNRPPPPTPLFRILLSEIQHHRHQLYLNKHK